MMMALAMTLHLLSVMIWVGGMFFAHIALRPAVNALLEPPQRLPLMAAILGRFFSGVWVAIGLLWSSGLWVIFGFYGGMGKVAISVHLMSGIAIVMTILFMFIFFVPFPKLKQAVVSKNFPEAGLSLAVIRKIIVVNLSLGVITMVVATVGKYFW